MPAYDMYYEDFQPGHVHESAGVTITRTMILDFARLYDPQPFHLDEIAAGESHFGGLIASGWQVAVLSFRMFAQSGILAPGAMGSPGLDKLRWHLPVRPGDTIRMRSEVLSARTSKTRDDRGYADLKMDVLNQKDEVVMSYLVTEILKRRPA